jgi:hypothetical protein
MSNPSAARNEDGYIAILAAIVILILLTIIGISASRVASTEVTMSRNEVVFKRNFYLAEGAALEAADRLTHYGNLDDHQQPWMEMVTGNLELDSLQSYWDNSTAAGDSVVPEPSQLDPNRTLFLVGHEGIAQGSTVDMEKAKVHSIAIYGRCEWNGVAIIKMGYRAAY